MASRRPNKPAKPVKPAKSAKAVAPPPKARRTGCAALDPFGDPCQSSPRLPSRYCTIHSYLDRQ